MTTMSGKAEGRCTGVEGVAGWFSPTFTGYAAAVQWRDGQTAHEPEVRARWLIIERIDPRWGVLRLWCLPPGMAARALADPTWAPDVPFSLLPPQTRWDLIDAAKAAGLPVPTPEPLVPRAAADSPAAPPKPPARRKQRAPAGS